MDGFEKYDKVYQQLQKQGIEVLYDDRDIQPGQKFADSDLIGISNRLVISNRSLQNGGIEFKKRTEEKGEVVKVEEVMKKFV